MLFNSTIFAAVFLPVVVAIYLFISAFFSKEVRHWWLIFASLLFYTWWFPPNTVLLLCSILINYWVGIRLQRGTVHARLLLVLGVTINLGIIALFKYSKFLLGSFGVTNLPVWIEGIALPLAISFYTFQQITFLVDSHRQRVKSTSFRDYMLYVVFFPQLIAGPIVHHSDVIPQFKAQGRSYDLRMGIMGGCIFCIGMAKKVIIADGMAEIASPVFDGVAAGMSVDFYQAWAAALGYTLQLYFDFSGYSDMAIGIGLIFNIKLPQNFNSPYKAGSIIEFWKRWHMTLSRFLRDYLYIPLGGNRRGCVRRYRNLVITMLLGGLWHGAAWTFVAWGGWHGILLAINHIWRGFCSNCDRASILSRLGKLFGRPMTLLAVVVGWVLFRANSFGAAGDILAAMFGFGEGGVVHSYSDHITVLAGIGLEWMLIVIGGIIVMCLPNSIAIGRVLQKTRIELLSFVFGCLAFVALACLLLNLSRAGASEFIYFNF